MKFSTHIYLENIHFREKLCSSRWQWVPKMTLHSKFQPCSSKSKDITMTLLWFFYTIALAGNSITQGTFLCNAVATVEHFAIWQKLSKQSKKKDCLHQQESFLESSLWSLIIRKFSGLDRFHFDVKEKDWMTQQFYKKCLKREST